MKTNLELYRVFHRVAAAGSVSKAAAELFVPQPAVSQSIRNLEESLGASLFVRLPRGMALTQEGRRLFAYIDQAIGLVDAAEREMEQRASLESGEIFVAAGDALCRYHLIPHLEAFHTAYPGVRLRITNRTSDATNDLLRSGRVDIGLVNMPCDSSDVEVEPIAEIRDCFVGGDQYHINRPRAWEEFLELPIILLERGTSTRRFLDAAFRERGIVLKPEFELGSVDLLVRFASMGLGISAVIREYAADEIEAGSVIELPLDPPLPSRHVGVAYRADTPLSAAAERLLGLIRGKKKQ